MIIFNWTRELCLDNDFTMHSIIIKIYQIIDSHTHIGLILRLLQQQQQQQIFIVELVFDFPKPKTVARKFVQMHVEAP
jgi:hypothetical protein